MKTLIARPTHLFDIWQHFVTERFSTDSLQNSVNSFDPGHSVYRNE